MTKIYTHNIEAGGVGKTALTVNGSFYLADVCKKKTLVIDKDPSRNLSGFMLRYLSHKTGRSVEELAKLLKPENKVRAIYEGGRVEPISITEDLDFIFGDETLYDLNTQIEKQDMINWFEDNSEQLTEYEYILIDTHNDKSIVTQNALALSDYVVAIVNADPKSLEKVKELQDRVDTLKKKIRFGKETPVNAEVVIIGNILDKSIEGLAMRELLDDYQEEKPKVFKGYIEDRKVIRKANIEATPLTEKAKQKRGQDKSIKKFYENTWKVFNNIYNIN